jgi:hypothetical protein
LFARHSPDKLIFVPLFFAIFLPLLIIGLAGVAFNIWMLVDAVNRPAESFNPPGARIWWIACLGVGLVASGLGPIVAIVYWFVVRKPGSRTPLT